MVSYGLVDLYDADNQMLLHKQVLYRYENGQAYLYKPMNIDNFEQKILTVMPTLSSVDVNFFCSGSLRALIDVTVHYIPGIFREINTDLLCEKTKISILETAFYNKVLKKLLKKKLHCFFLGKTFFVNEEDSNGAKLLTVEKIIGQNPINSVVFKHKKRDVWSIIRVLEKETDVSSENIYILDSEIYRYYMKKNYKKMYRHYFSYRKDKLTVKSQCELVWFDPPKPNVSHLKQMR